VGQWNPPRHRSLTETLVSAAAFAAAALCALAAIGPARAEPVFINQLSGTLRAAETVAVPTAPGPASNAARSALIAQPSVPTAPSIVPGLGGANVASTLEMGIGNTVAQMQFGAGNQSSVAVLGGRQNNVGVLQAGNNLRSQVALVNTQGLSVGVLQPANSAPVNVFVARLPGGGLLIKP
jgi:hypothetical protein